MDTPEPMLSCIRSLTSFPHLAESEFEQACSALLTRFELHGHRQHEWAALDVASQNETKHVKITKALCVPPSPSAASSRTEVLELDEDDYDDDDDDEVAQTFASPQAVVQYDILLSPTYRVPVLYFAISDTQHRYPPTMETLYSLVIPQKYKAQAENVGIIGGITITDHPLTNKPVFFIHPCQTAQVLEASVGARDMCAYDYLIMWIGAMGKCVGLNVPMALVTRAQTC